MRFAYYEYKVIHVPRPREIPIRVHSWKRRYANLGCRKDWESVEGVGGEAEVRWGVSFREGMARVGKWKNYT